MQKPFWKLLLAIGAMLALQSADAKPEYARKEQRACQYCHVSGTPGSINPEKNEREPTTRNARGKYYADHNHSFTGYVEPTAPKTGTTLAFKFLWKEAMPENPRRMAVADVVGDGKPRLITLHEKADDKKISVLTVRKWDGKAFSTEFTAESNAPADKLQVGKFAGAKAPALIVTADALWKWDGKTFVATPAPHPLALFGTTRLKDGSEVLMLAPSTEEIKAYRINPTQAGNWLLEMPKPPQSAESEWGDMHAKPEFFARLQLPGTLIAGGIIGVWDCKKNGKSILYHSKVDGNIDITADAKDRNKPQFLIKDPAYFLTVRDPRTTTLTELWTSPRLPGTLMDILVDDPKAGGKPGFLVLVAAPDKAKGSLIGFFVLE